MLVYFFNLFSTLISEPSVSKRWHVKPAEVYLLLKLDDKQESPSTMSSVFSWISSVVGSLKIQMFFESPVSPEGFWRMRMLAGIWSKGRLGFFGCPEILETPFCRRSNFWTFFSFRASLFRDLVHDRWGPAGKATPESRGPWFCLRYAAKPTSCVGQDVQTQQITTCRVEIDFNISQYTYVNPMWNEASIPFGLVLVALLLVRIHILLILF